MNRIFATFAGFLLLSSAPAHANSFVGQSAANTSAWISETANGTDGFNQAYDNFAFSAGGTSTQVQWTGWLLPSYGTLNGFTISFYDDAVSGLTHIPGTQISSTFVAGDANQVNSGTHGGFGVFDFSASVPFTAAAGTQYWISIVAAPQRSTTWQWANSNGGDGSFYENDGNGTAGPVGTDLAFSLTSTAVPEPSTLMLCGSGLLGLAGVGGSRLRRK